jgi:hypothetical protein
MEPGGFEYLLGHAECDAVDQKLLPQGERGRGRFLQAAEVFEVAAEGLPAGVEQGTLRRASHPERVQNRAESRTSVAEDAPDDLTRDGKDEEAKADQEDHSPHARA